MGYIRYLSMGSLLTPLSLLTYNISAEIVTIEPTSPYLPAQTGLMTPLGNPVYSSAVRQTPSFFYFTSEQVFRLNPATGQWEWVDNAAAINPIQQGD